MHDRDLETLSVDSDGSVALSPGNDGESVKYLLFVFDLVDVGNYSPFDQIHIGRTRTSGQYDDNCSLETSSGTEYDSNQEECSGPTQMHPIFMKLQDISNQFEVMKKERGRSCDDVKGIESDSLHGHDAFTSLQNLTMEHETLRKKYAEETELLKRKYLEEHSERKKLYNEITELKGNIRVFCRCRPLKEHEIANGSTSVIDFDASQENELHITCSDLSRKQFRFDHVFRPGDNQDSVFHQTLPLVSSVLDGYNVCIFAYGQTGTGKTYTMEGTPGNRGVNYRTLEMLFKTSEERSSIMRCELFVSMLEVYNEKIRDLLVDCSNQPEKKLEIKQSAEGTQEVPGLTEARVFNTDEIWRLLKSGSQARSVGSTNANELSSRSHCLLRVTVVAEDLLSRQRTKSHLWLIDLAGSERVSRTEVEGDRLKESQFINKSLSALGDVISALASKSFHVPYRNSKLTHLLQSSLGGDCKTLMFVQISPNSADLGETLCSLNFASRVRGIEQGPARRQPDHGELSKYKQLAEKAKADEKEIKRLQENVQSLQLRLTSREHICKSLQDKVRDIENQLAEERKARLKVENRALASISVQSSKSNQGARTSTVKKPPLAPSNMRIPLRRISNVMPSSTTKTSRTPFLPTVLEEKENASRPFLMKNMGKPNLKARRGSFIAQPTTTAATSQAFQPRRRASIAATMQPNFLTPLHSSRKERVTGRQSFACDPHRVWRSSRVVSPPLQRKIEATPLSRLSSRFKGSPPVGWKPKKHLVWSPLKMKAMKNKRYSFLP